MQNNLTNNHAKRQLVIYEKLQLLSLAVYPVYTLCS